MARGIGHIHDSLLAQIDRLSDPDLTPEQLDREIRRSESLTKLAATAIVNARLALDAEKLAVETGRSASALGPILGAPDGHA